MLTLDVIPWTKTLLVSGPTNHVAPHISRTAEALDAEIAGRNSSHPILHKHLKGLVVHEVDASRGWDRRPGRNFGFKS